MIRTDRLTIVAVLLLTALAGCAHGISGAPALSGSGVDRTGDPRTTAAPDTCTGDPAATRLRLTEADNGSSRCLSVAGVVDLYLQGTANGPWSPVELSGTGLRVAATGKGSLPIGVTAGFFAGTGPGEARLSAFRSPCVSADPTAPGCDDVHLVLITIVLR